MSSQEKRSVTLKTQMASDLGAVFFNTDDFATAATYRDSPDGADVSCSIIVEEQPGSGLEPAGQARAARIYVSGSTVTAPCTHGQFTVTETGRVWQILQEPQDEDGVWVCDCVADRRPRA